MPRGVRPTSNIVRKALFDLLGQDLSGTAFLDLFAGSGAVGLEAVSRGSMKVTFVEKEARFAEVIQENLALLNTTATLSRGFHFEVINTDAFAAVKLLARQQRKFDIVFLDPPYGLGLAKKALKTLEAYDIVHPNSTVIAQHDPREILPHTQGRFCRFREKKYGETILSLYKILSTKP